MVVIFGTVMLVLTKKFEMATVESLWKTMEGEKGWLHRTVDSVLASHPGFNSQGSQFFMVLVCL